MNPSPIPWDWLQKSHPRPNWALCFASHSTNAIDPWWLGAEIPKRNPQTKWRSVVLGPLPPERWPEVISEDSELLPRWRSAHVSICWGSWGYIYIIYIYIYYHIYIKTNSFKLWIHNISWGSRYQPEPKWAYAYHQQEHPPINHLCDSLNMHWLTCHAGPQTKHTCKQIGPWRSVHPE